MLSRLWWRLTRSPELVPHSVLIGIATGAAVGAASASALVLHGSTTLAEALGGSVIYGGIGAYVGTGVGCVQGLLVGLLLAVLPGSCWRHPRTSTAAATFVLVLVELGVVAVRVNSWLPPGYVGLALLVNVAPAALLGPVAFTGSPRSACPRLRPRHG